MSTPLFQKASCHQAEAEEEEDEEQQQMQQEQEEDEDQPQDDEGEGEEEEEEELERSGDGGEFEGQSMASRSKAARGNGAVAGADDELAPKRNETVGAHYKRLTALAKAKTDALYDEANWLTHNTVLATSWPAGTAPTPARFNGDELREKFGLGAKEPLLVKEVSIINYNNDSPKPYGMIVSGLGEAVVKSGATPTAVALTAATAAARSASSSLGAAVSGAAPPTAKRSTASLQSHWNFMIQPGAAHPAAPIVLKTMSLADAAEVAFHAPHVATLRDTIRSQSDDGSLVSVPTSGVLGNALHDKSRRDLEAKQIIGRMNINREERTLVDSKLLNRLITKYTDTTLAPLNMTDVDKMSVHFDPINKGNKTTTAAPAAAAPAAAVATPAPATPAVVADDHTLTAYMSVKALDPAAVRDAHRYVAAADKARLLYEAEVQKQKARNQQQDSSSSSGKSKAPVVPSVVTGSELLKVTEAEAPASPAAAVAAVSTASSTRRRVGGAAAPLSGNKRRGHK